MPRPKPDPQPALAYSYLRFSSPEQARGDSVRRQTELRDQWLREHGVMLDTSVTLRDDGVSAFSGKHRENPDRNALAAFLELAKRGRVPRGSYLIVENLDRLSREHIRPALTLLLNLIEHGVRVVQLLPVATVYDDRVEPMALMMAIMELSRGHSESRMKSERVSRAWQAKKARALATGEPVTHAVPAWLRIEGGKFHLVEEAAATIRRIYQLATEGFGANLITRRLNAEGVPAIGKADYWARTTVAKLLLSRTVTGEYQPHKGHGTKNRVKDGPPIPNYFPAVVTEQQWQAARGVITNRHNGGGRPSERVNLFAGMLRDARDGSKLYRIDKGGQYHRPTLVNHKAAAGVQGSRYVSFPLDVFEDAILSKLREIDPREILPGDTSGGRVLALKGRLADLQARSDRITAQLVGGDEDVAPLMDVIRNLDAEQKAAGEELAAEQRRAASPLSDVWGEALSLVDALAASPDQVAARTRLRSALRRMIAEAWCLFVPKGLSRLAAVQLWFEGGAHRDYLIGHIPARGNQSGGRKRRWFVRSLALPGRAGELDLRKPGDVADLERVLAALDVAGLG